MLGVFTNNGNVNLAPNPSYNSDAALSLQVHAAIVAFNSDVSDDNGQIDGSITYTGNTLSSTDKWTLVGSRVQAKINNIGYSTRNIYFDQRFSGGGFRPPFFPGTTYVLDTQLGAWCYLDYQSIQSLTSGHLLVSRDQLALQKKRA